MNNSNFSQKFKTVSSGSRNEPFTSNKSWSSNGRKLDRRQGRKRELTPERNWNRRPYDRKHRRMQHDSPERDSYGDQFHKRIKRRNSREAAGSAEQSQQAMQMHPPTSYSSNEDANSNYFAVDPSWDNYMMPNYNTPNTINQWGAPINPGTDMASSSAGMNPYPYMVSPEPPTYEMLPPIPDFFPMPKMENIMQPQTPLKCFSRCILYPPSPSVPPPTFRPDRPNHCKTVLVGGLPEKITQEIIKEVFSECGEVSNVKMGRKNFCHIRFKREDHVDKALLFSGYHMRIENKDETPYRGCLLVEATSDDPFRTSPPPPTMHYSEHESATVGEQLRNEETFKQACQVLISWLQRGECNKKNASKFYSMIQSTYSPVRRLEDEKTKIKCELEKLKKKLTQKSISNGAQFNDIEKVLKCATIQKVWDQFTKVQRRNIGTWINNTSAIKKRNIEDMVEDRVEDEMELSEQEGRASPADSDKSENNEHLSRFADKGYWQEENDKLQNDIALLRRSLLLASTEVNISDRDIRLAMLIAIFLQCHGGFIGASIDYICSYLFNYDRTVNTRDVEALMKKLTIVFKEKSTGIGATLKKKWYFIGFENL